MLDQRQILVPLLPLHFGISFSSRRSPHETTTDRNTFSVSTSAAPFHDGPTSQEPAESLSIGSCRRTRALVPPSRRSWDNRPDAWCIRNRPDLPQRHELESAFGQMVVAWCVTAAAGANPSTVGSGLDQDLGFCLGVCPSYFLVDEGLVRLYLLHGRGTPEDALRKSRGRLVYLFFLPTMG